MVAALVPFLVATTAVGAVGSIAALASGPGKPPSPARAPTRDDVAGDVRTQDALARRRGSAADVMLGPSAGEATGGAGPKVLTGE